MTECDIIVVGAGSAGSVLADQLARRYQSRVVLVEPDSMPAPRIDRERPASWLKLLGSGDDWNLSTEPAAALAGRSIAWPRGRGLGGSGRINAMIWFPPTDVDRNDLQSASGGAWSEADFETCYQEAEMLVRPESPRWLSDPARRFMESVGDWPNALPFVYRRVCRGGRRWTPAEALDSNSGVRIVRGTVDRVLFDADKACGVMLGSSARRGSDKIHATQGVVLCAGAIASPTILMRSGIGPREMLQDANIDVRVDAPRVGCGLQDHLTMPVIFRLPTERRFRAEPSVADLTRWQTIGAGPIASNIAECGGLFDNGRFQIHVTPTHYLSYPKPDAAAAMTLAVNVARPASRGRLTIRSNDVNSPPILDAGYLSEESDLQGTIDGVRVCRTIATATPLSRWHRGELLPGSKRQSDESIAKSIARYAQTLYHPVGTCRMGTDPDSVVDPSLRVRGVDRLWVVDGSILPRVPCGNPNAIVISLAIWAASRWNVGIR